MWSLAFFVGSVETETGRSTAVLYSTAETCLLLVPQQRATASLRRFAGTDTRPRQADTALPCLGPAALGSVPLPESNARQLPACGVDSLWGRVVGCLRVMERGQCSTLKIMNTERSPGKLAG